MTSVVHTLSPLEIGRHRRLWCNCIIVSVVLLLAVVKIPCQSTLERSNWTALAESYIDQGNLDSAAMVSKLLVDQIRHDDRDFQDSFIYDAYRLHGRIQNKLEKLHDANKTFSEAVSILSRSESQNFELISRIRCEVAYNYNVMKDFEKINTQLDELRRLDSIYAGASLFVKAYIETLAGMSLLLQNKMSQAHVSFEKALDLYKHSPDSQSVEMLRCMDHQALCYLREGRYEEAAHIYQLAILKIKSFSGDNFESISIYEYDLATVYSEAGETKKAIRHFVNNIKAIKAHEGEQSPMLGANYINLSVIYNRMNLKQRAIHYLELAEHIYKPLYGPSYSSLSYVYANLAQLHAELSNFEQAQIFVSKAEQVILSNWGIESTAYAINLVFKSQIFSQMGEHEAAYNTIKKANDFLKKFGAESKRTLLQCRLQEAIFMMELHMDKEAEIALNHVYRDAEAILPGPDKLKVSVDGWLSTVYLDVHDFEKATFHNERSLRNARYDYFSNNYREALSLDLVIDGLQRKYELLKTVTSDNPSRRDQLQEIDQRIVDIFQYNLRSFDEDEDRYFLKKKFFDAAEKIHENYYSYNTDSQHAFDLEHVFKLLQLYKNTNLVSDLTFSSDQESSLAPKDYVHADQRYGNRIKKLKHKLGEFKTNTEVDSIEFLLTRDSMISLMDNRMNLRDKLRQEHPRYYEMKYGEQLIEINDIQQTLLGEHDLFVEYFIGDSAIYQLVIGPDSANYYRTPIDDQFNLTLNRWLKNLTSPQTSASDLCDDGQVLYHYFLGECLRDKKHVENLIIVCDGVGHYVPFEVLCSYAEPDSVRYLVEDMAISYCVSSSLAVGHPNAKPANSSFGGFAVNYANQAIKNEDEMDVRLRSTASYRLRETVDEVSAIHSIVGGQIYLNEAATESRFKREVGQMDVIHLSVHGEYNNEEPMNSALVFSNKDTLNDGLLTTAEIYSLSLKAEMAVLSACETGLGELKKGEGIMGLSRAFRHAGVKSNVVSLWKVPDHATSRIMQRFYFELKAGEPKNKAMRTAKLNYLTSVIEPELKHPFYWAGFIVQGNTRPLVFKDMSSWRSHWSLGLFLLFSILGLFYLYKYFE